MTERNDKEWNALAASVTSGLSKEKKTFSSRFFYDNKGSRLFEQIMEQPEYYLTECEIAIFETYGAQIVEQFGKEPLNLVELGAGNGVKTTILLKQMVKTGLDFRYIPVDISKQALRDLESQLQKKVPEVPFEGLHKEYMEGVRWLQEHDERKNVMLFLGSNIGNFLPEYRYKFLQQLSNVLSRGDQLIMGFDLKKDPDIILPAYSDSRGVTASFNLNLLERINRELRADFDLAHFTHYATYNPNIGAIESYIMSKRVQTVRVKALEREFHFDAWEPIHTEYSFKFSLSEIETMAREHGFQYIRPFTDRHDYFADALWQV